MATSIDTFAERAKIRQFLSKTWTGALSTAEVTADMFLLLYDESSQTSEPYKCIEESLKFCCPDFVAPKKWSNMYRHATNLVKKGLGQVKIFGDHSSTSSSTKNSSVGYHCNKLGLLKDDLRNQSCRLAEKFHKKTIMNVGAFREICLFKKAEGKTWNDVKDWIFAITLNKVNVQKICYSFQKIHKKFTDLSKRGEKQQAEVFLSVDFSSFLSENVKRQTHGQNKENKSSRVTDKKLLIKNIELQKEVIEVNRENNLLSDIIKEESRKSEQLTKKLLTIKSKNEENIDLKQKLAQSNKTLKSIKRENFYKRVKRRETNIQRKQNKVYKNLQSAKEKISDLTAKQIKQEDKLRKLEHSKAEAVKDLKHKLHCKSNQICYFRSAKEKSTEELTRQKISLENEKQRNIVLNNQNINLQEQIQENEKNIETKTKGRYCDEMRSCILELSSLEIPSNKVSSVVNSVSKSLFNVKVDTPSKTTVQNIISEGNVISHQQVAHELLESDNWGVFSDGTSRDGKKIVDIGVHTNKQSFSLGFIPVAVENSETVSNVIQSKISDAANVVNNVVNFEDGNIENKNRLLKAFTSVMSDRSSVMKKTNVLLDEWRKQTLKQGGLHNDEIKNLEFLYCSAHVLLGFHSEMEKQVKSYEKVFGPIDRDSLGMFKNYRQNNEPAAFRAIRTASECLGPNGDEKNGARQHWLSYCEMNNKKSQIISYRSNRFNNLYDGARTVLLHRNDIIDFFSNHFSNPNLKLKSVLGDISCEKVYTNIVCLAAIGCYVTSPFWDLVNSNEHYLDLHNFFQPMYEQMKLWSENCEAVFDGEVDPIFTKYPHKLNESYNILLQELKKVKESGIQAFSLMCKSISRVMERQLADFLPEGIYSKDATEDHKKSTAHTKITNIPAENLFGDLDYSIKRKHNASVFHHSSIVMLKRNKTVNWLKRKHIFLRSQIMATGRKHAKLYKQRSKAIEKEVSRKRQNILKETKQKKVLKQQKSETELRRIENSVKSMGGIVKSLRDIEHLLHVTKNLKEKKLKLRDQLLYIKLFMGKEIDKKCLYVTTNSVLKYKQTLIDVLGLNKEKEIEIGTWVSVAYQDGWFPGEVTEILTNQDRTYKINFMKPKRSGSNAFVWPNPVDNQNVDPKFAFYSHFDVTPTAGLRYFFITDFEDIVDVYTEYKEKYF